MAKRLLWWIVIFAWCIMIFSITESPAATSENTSSIIKYLTNAPQVLVDIIDYIVRKMAHVSLFGLLAVFLYLANQERKKAPILAWFLATLYGATDEIHQIFAPGRTPLVTDVLIDSVGAVIALLLYSLLRKVIKKNKL
jgi:VanZ family protein